MKHYMKRSIAFLLFLFLGTALFAQEVVPARNHPSGPGLPIGARSFSLPAAHPLISLIGSPAVPSNPEYAIGDSSVSANVIPHMEAAGITRREDGLSMRRFVRRAVRR